MKSCTRRQLLKTSLVAGSFAILPEPLLAANRQPLWIPPLIESRRGKPVFLNMQSIQRPLLDNNLVEVWGFNGQYLGPTVRVKRGDFVKLSYSNNLPQFVAMNVQGVVASSELLGGVGRNIQTGQSWSPIVQISQPAATCWYHATTLANSAYQTYRGLVGMWLIDDEESRQSQLPKNYGVNDIPLILQDVKLNKEGAQLFTPTENHFIGERLLVNGREAPFIELPRGLVRLRILNASLSRPYELSFDDEREMQVIATDQGFLAKAQKLRSIFLSPGERIELLVDLNDGEDVRLIVGKKRGLLDKISHFFSSDNELVDNTVLEIRPQGLPSAFNSEQEFSFNNHYEKMEEIQQEREFYLDAQNGLINQQRFDPRRIDVNAKLGSVERWIISANQPTGFRVQGAKFLIESIDGKAVVQENQGWKDCIWVQGKISLLVRFTSMSSNNYPFIFGSSDLMLADKGCIGLMVVQ